VPATPPPLIRWVLLVAVIAGVFGMHVLTAGDGPGHGMLPVAMAPDHHGAAPDAVTERTPPGPAVAHLAGCVLFLVAGGAVLLLVALARLGGAGDRADDRRAGGLLRDLRRRGPPDGWPRLALNVIRV
jgi:hypothetical protein